MITGQNKPFNMENCIMDYRNLPQGEEQISVIGFGTSSIGAGGSAELDATMELALEQGINYFDLASADAAPFSALGRVLGEQRN